MPPRAYREMSDHEELHLNEYGMPIQQVQPFQPSAGESKRDRRRRELGEKIERMRRDILERHDQTFHEKLTRLHEQHVLLSTKPYPTEPLFLLRLHELSVQRDATLLGVKSEYARAREASQKTHKLDIERIQEEYDLGKRAVIERLTEACEERSRKLKEEKDSLELNLETLFEPQARMYATRRNRIDTRALLNGTTPTASTSLVPLPPALDRGIENEPFGNSLLPGSPLINSFSLPGSQQTGPAGIAALYAALSSNGGFSSLGLTGNMNGAAQQPMQTGPGLRVPRKRGIGPPPSQQFAIVPGRYEFIGKALSSLTSLKADELQDDLEQMRRKRRRGGNKRRFDFE